MRIREVWTLARRALKRNRLRTLLTVLGLAVGIGAIIAVDAIGNGGGRSIAAHLRRFGTGRIWISSRADAALTADQAVLLEEEMGDATVSAVSSRAVQLTRDGGAAMPAEMVACDPNLSAVEDIGVINGRFLRSQDHEFTRHVTALDRHTAREIFGTENPVGREVQIDGITFRVIGVVDPPGVPFAPQLKGRCYVPISICERLYGIREVDQITLTVSSDAVRGGERAVRILGGDERYAFTTMVAEQAAAEQILNIFIMVMSGVAAVSMLSGGIGVMNILLVGVRERRREIGIMKALGAQSNQILMQFLLEALLYSLYGVAFGWILGIILGIIGAKWIGFPVSISIRALFSAAFFGCMVGLASGVLPAWEASRLRPVAAMREE